MWIAAAIWAANATVNFLRVGELSVLNVFVTLIWALLAALCGRPYAVIAGQVISIAAPPLRPKKFRRDQIVSYSETKPGIARLGLAGGATLVVRINEVRTVDQDYLRSQLTGTTGLAG
jgi:hypothetical protein